MDMPLATSRLLLRDWWVEDAEAASHVYGAPEVTRRLTPVMQRGHDVAAMRRVLHAWVQAQPNRCRRPGGGRSNGARTARSSGDW